MHKKRILILGSGGMAGHMIAAYFRSLNKYNVMCTARSNDRDALVVDIETDLKFLKSLIGNTQPNIIINCVGVLIKYCEDYPEKAMRINGQFPHWLEDLTKNTDVKIIHLSTDCVFDGERGNYGEGDVCSGVGPYAASKIAGEIINDKDLTLRLSIIGSELKKDGSGLYEWFMRQENSVYGYRYCFWNGITTLELAKQIDKIIDYTLTGIYHLVPNFKISKLKLLEEMARVWCKEIQIISVDEPMQNKTLVNNRLCEYDPKIPSYSIQLQEMQRKLKCMTNATINKF